MQPRTLYHTSIKYLAFEGLLTTEIARQIPRSNIHRWRTQLPERYKSFKLNVSDDYDLLREFVNNDKAKKVFRAYVRLLRFVIGLAHRCRDFHRKLKDHKAQAARLIHDVRKTVSIQRVLRILNISHSTYRLWSLTTATECLHSPTNSCNRVFPNQLSRPQVSTLRDMVLDPNYQFWPISSIAWHALRNNILAINLNTWYKYVRKLGLKRQTPPSRNKKRNTSVRATKPNELWHADISSFVTSDNIKHFIYLVADNFSRKILSWRVEESVKALLRKESVEDAIQHATLLHGVRPVLITDGGSENQLNDISAIDHKIALVDVVYSNSLIEAHNKLLKYNYLYKMQIDDVHQLRNQLAFIISDFNQRPHISLDGLTPNEAYENQIIDREKLKSSTNTSAIERYSYNKSHWCEGCTD